VVDGVNDLLGRKPPVHGLEGGAHAGDAEKAFEVAVAVEVEHRHHVAGLYSQTGQSVRQPVNSLMKRAVGAAELVAVDDFLVGGVYERGREKLLQDQGTRRILQAVGFPSWRLLIKADPRTFSNAFHRREKERLSQQNCPDSETRRFRKRPLLGCKDSQNRYGLQDVC
jgi:hypothetical protein